MTILYTCTNTNLKTVKLVANASNLIFSKSEDTKISKVVLFSSPENSNYILFQNWEIYQKILGEEIRIERVPLDEKGLCKTANFVEVFNNSYNKCLDLTNGQKATTSQLYHVASLLKIDSIYYTSLLLSPKELPDNPVMGKHYEYLKLPPLTNVSDLTSLTYFDLIFYMEEIENIFWEVPENSFLSEVSNDLRKSVSSFFKGDSYRSAISDATTSTERLINDLIEFLQNYLPAQQFSQEFGIKFKQKDPLGIISYFFRTYSQNVVTKQDKYFDENLASISTLHGLLSSLRMFRNISAHSAMSHHKFRAHEVRICINIALESFRCVKASQEFWKKLLAK